MISLLKFFCTVCDPEKSTFGAIHQQCRKVKVLPQKVVLSTKCLCHAKVYILKDDLVHTFSSILLFKQRSGTGVNCVKENNCLF
mgnify:CR=1 FL=1